MVLVNEPSSRADARAVQEDPALAQRSASPSRGRLGPSAAAVALLLTAGLLSSPGSVLARASRARTNRVATAQRPQPARVAVSVGWTHGTVSREDIVGALSVAVAREPNLRWAPSGGTVVINATVRALTIQRDGTDALARCELSLVVTDGGGAVQGMLESRRVVRSAGPEDAVAQAALRDALAGAVHRLASAL